MAANSDNSHNNNNNNNKVHLSDEKVEKEKNEKVADSGEYQDNKHQDKVKDKDKDDVVTVDAEEEKVVKIDDDGENSDNDSVKDENNNDVVVVDDQIPDGAVGLPEEDVEMPEVGCGRVLANQVARAVETMLDDSRAWFRMWLPDGEPGIVALGLHTTVREVNTRLANAFGQGVFFLGYRLVTGLTISASLNLTMSELDAMGLDLGIGTMANDWFGEARED